MIIARYFVYFMFYSFLGWVWETFYCAVCDKHFSNRGFLFGPVCPIYGFCVLALQVLLGCTEKDGGGQMPVWELFLICAFGSAVIEYATSYYLEQRFHASWWDYSRMPLNLHGRICLPVACGFGAGGVVISRYVLPAFSHAGSSIHPLIYEALAMALMGVLGADFALTEASLNSLIERIDSIEKELTRRADSAAATVAGTPQTIELKVRSLEGEVKTRASQIASSLNRRQKAVMDRIRSFQPIRSSRYQFHFADRLKDSIHELRSRGREDKES